MKNEIQGPRNITRFPKQFSSACPSKVMFQFCLMHIVQLIAQLSLGRLDKLSKGTSFGKLYFSQLAKLSNSWRSPGTHVRMQKVVNERFPTLVKVLASSIPGRCLRGRWGSVDEVEDRVCLPGCAHALPICYKERPLGPYAH